MRDDILGLSGYGPGPVNYGIGFAVSVVAPRCKRRMGRQGVVDLRIVNLNGRTS